MVAFASLLVSGIRPVIDFGWMMVTGMAVVLCVVFCLFPAGLMLLKPGVPQRHRDFTGAITGVLAFLVERRRVLLALSYLLIVIIGAYGITRLTIENRFIGQLQKHHRNISWPGDDRS